MSLQLLHERDELGLERGEQLAHEAPRLGGAAPRLAPLPALAPLAVAAVALTSLSYLVTYAFVGVRSVYGRIGGNWPSHRLTLP